MPRTNALLPTAAALVIALCVACGGPLERAQDRAEAYYANHVTSVDPGWANLFGYMNRRFGLQLRDAAGHPLDAVPGEQDRPEIAALYARLHDPQAAVEPAKIASLPNGIDRMTAVALHCDRISLPANWAEILRQASEVGGYGLTHATLAGQWSLENGCASWAEIGPVQREQIERLIALVEDREALTSAYSASADIWIEAIVMLYYAGATSRIQPAWIDALLSLQREDGGWPRSFDAETSDPHATALAVWVLQESLHPEAEPITWIPQRGALAEAVRP